MNTESANIFQKRHDEKQELEAAALEKFLNSTRFAAEMASQELPAIQAVFDRVAKYKQEVFGDLPESQLPVNLRLIIGQIEAIRATPNTIKAALAERNRIQASQLSDNRAPAITGNILTRLSHGRGCAASIERHFMRLQMEVDRFRQLHDASYDAPPEPVLVVTVPPALAAAPSKKRYDVRSPNN